MGVLDDYATRLQTSRNRIQQLRDLAPSEIERRNTIILEALQHGMSIRKAASVAGVSRARVYKLLGNG